MKAQAAVRSMVEPGPEFDGFAAVSWPRLVRAGWLLTGDWQRAEDLAQATLAKTWRHWSRVTAADDPDRYVRKILGNEFLRSRHRWWRHEARTAFPQDPAEAGFEAAVLSRDVLRRALDALPPGQRLVLVLRYYMDMSERDTAAALDCSVGNVKSQAARGLEKLRQTVDDGAGVSGRGDS